MRKRQVRPASCVYCGQVADTHDHIPPRSLFREKRAANPITVPACHKCSGQASKDDQLFVSALAMRHGSQADEEILSRVKRSLSRPAAAGLARTLISSLRVAHVVTPFGLYAGRRHIVDVDLERLSTVPTRIVKGLYYVQHGCRLANEYEVETIAASGLQTADASLKSDILGLVSSVTERQAVVTESEFSCWTASCSDVPDASVWVSWFYGQTAFISFVGPR